MIHYRFILDEQTELDFEIDDNGDSSDESGLTEIPRWLALDAYTCDHCPLPPGSRRTCPAALALKPVVDAFGDRVAHETVKVIVQLEGLKLEAVSPTQNAVRSLAGLLMPLSACPYMQKLRPMAHFHLPFGSRERTIFRSLGMYLIAQRLRQLNGLEPDWSMEGLHQAYVDIHRANCKIADRLRAGTRQDAAVNSLVILDSFADAIEMSIEQSFKQLESLFAVYLAEG